MQESSKASGHASSIIQELTIEQFLDLHRNNISLDHIYILTYFKSNPSVILPPNERIQSAIQFLIRKTFLTEDLVITKLGEALLEGCRVEKGRKVFSTLKETKSSAEEMFEQWWNAFPVTDKFDYQGRRFEGFRSFRCKKEPCKRLFIKIVNEGKYTAEDLISALKLEIKMKKEESLRKSENMMRYLRNTHTYLLNETFEAFIERSRVPWDEEGPLDNMSI